MLRTCLKISMRNLSKNKLFATINVFSLVIGLATCIVIYLVAAYEFGFDSFHTGKKSIYRLVGIKTGETGDGRPQAGAAAPLAQYINNSVPGVEVAVAFYPLEASIRVPAATSEGVKFDNKASYGSGRSTIVTGPDYFKIMQYKWLAGNAASALKDPYQVVLSRFSASKFFGDVAPLQIIGRQLTFNDSLHVHVSGIVEDWNKQTDFPFTEFISVATAQSGFLQTQLQPAEWGNGDNPGWQTLVKLKSITDVAQTDRLISAIASKNMRLEKNRNSACFYGRCHPFILTQV